MMGPVRPAPRRPAMARLPRPALFPLRRAPQNTLALFSRRTAALLAGALLANGAVALAPAAAGAAEAPYPPATTFKEVQLKVLTCGRENSAASCSQARSLADPLLDHPRLSTSCKDALWSVRQKAVTAEGNSAERRDGLDRISRDVAAYCRQPYQPSASQSEEKGGRKPFSLLSPTSP